MENIMSTSIYLTKTDDHSEELLKLMIKKHMKVGIKYLCKTIQEDHNKYPGSGTGWKEILEEHGKEHVKTKVIFTTHSKSEFKKVAEMLSDKWDIVNSKDWANKKKEVGDGGSNGPISEETKAKQSAAHLKRYEDPKERKKSSDAQLKAHEENPEIKERKSAAQLKSYEENPERAKNISAAIKKRYEDPKERKKSSDAQLKAHEENPEIKERKSAAQTKRYEDPKARKKTRDAMLKRYEDPKEREKTSAANIKRYEDPKERKKTSDAMLKRYEDPKERKKASDRSKKRYNDPKEREKTGRNSATVHSNKRAAKSVEFVDVLRSAFKQ